MSKRQEILKNILIDRFGECNSLSASIDRHDLTNSGHMTEVREIYNKLGGILSEPPLKLGRWDLPMSDFIVELDEEQHFNRYRAITLTSEIYRTFVGFDSDYYRHYCSEYEEQCLKKSAWGKYWTSSSTEKQFGKLGQGNIMNGTGSPRWKQRAFYDYLRDVYSLVYKVPLLRISVYDQISIRPGCCSVDNILSTGDNPDLNELVKFIEQKIRLGYDVA